MADIESKNIDISAWRSKSEKTDYWKILWNTKEKRRDEDTAKEGKKAEDELIAKIEWTENKQDTPTTTKETETQWTEIPLTVEQKQNVITGVLKKNNIDPTKYPTQIKNLANRVGTPTENTIMEIIANSNNIAKLGEEKWIRGKIFSSLWFSSDKIT